MHWVVIDAAAIANLDYTAARVVREMLKQVAAQGVKLGFVRVPQYLAADLRRHHLMEVIDPSMIFPRLHDVADDYAKRHATTAFPTHV